MKTRGLLWLLFFSIAGYATVFLLFPKAMPAARWQHNLDRPTAVARAKEIAHSLGIENIENTASSKWVSKVEMIYDRKTEYYLNSQGPAAYALGRGLFTPLRTSVTFNNPQESWKVSVELNSSGVLVLFETLSTKDKGSKESKKGEDGKDAGWRIKIGDKTATGNSENPQLPPPSKEVSETDRQIAEAAIKSFWGEKLLESASLSESSSDQTGSRLIWKAPDSSAQKLRLTIRASVSEGRIKELSLVRNFTPQFESEYESRRGRLAKFLSYADVLAILPAILLVIIVYFVAQALKQIQQRQGLIFFAAAFLLHLTFSLFSDFADDFRGSVGVNNYWLILAITWLMFMLSSLAVAGSLYFFWAAGQAWAIKTPPPSQRRTISIELILKGKILTRPVARSFAIGLLAGGIVVAIPLLARVSGLFPGIELDSDEWEDYFIAPAPALAAFVNSGQYLLFVIFGFMSPLISAFIKLRGRPLLARLVIFVICSLGMIGTSMVYISASALLVTGLLTALALTIIYFRGDLLAVLIAQAGAEVAINAATLLAQPAASLQHSGWRAIAILAGLAVVSLIGVWKFREVAEEETAIPAYLLETRDERERLKAEFNVARRAQQQMLPDATPSIPGFEIAAVCKPSREVGGDLYDFLSLSDGRLGIVVADVSGKGVPASLYMTLTKGLLVSVAETADDPGEILREVNRHLYEVCRRKMFVTLFLGVIDPATKQLVYARAGHNPTVFRRVSRQETSLLKSKGMGLGLNNGKIFDQSLKVETLQLEADDRLFFYSDGITEAMNAVNEEYGEDRLMEIVAKADSLAASEARDAVMADVTKFLGSNQPQDDQTLVVVKVV